MRKERKNEKGFTMVELIIVVAIMGIIGALLVPAYGSMTTKARLTTDINTVKTLSRTAASYKAEKGTAATGAGADQLAAINTALKGAGYLDQAAAFQTKDVKLVITEDATTGAQTFTLDVTAAIAANASIKDALNKMSSDVDEWITGYKPDHTK